MRTARAALVMIVAAVISSVVPALDGVPGSPGNIVAAATSTAPPESTIVIGGGGGAGDAVRVGIGLALIVVAVGATILLTRRNARRRLAR